MDTSEFFRALYRHVPPKAFVRVGPKEQATFARVSELCEGSYTCSGTDVFFSPGVFKVPSAKRVDVWGASVAWVDFDGTSNLIPPIPLLPASIVVASGGPGHLHYYWLLDSMVDPETLEEVNKALHVHVQASGGTWNANRILRVPGTFNGRYEPPAPVEVLRADTALVYRASTLVRLQVYDTKILKVPQGKTRSERDWVIARTLLSWGIPSDDVKRALLILSSDKTSEHPDPEHYADITVRKAEESLNGREGVKGGRKGKATRRRVANFWVKSLGKLIDKDGHDCGLLLQIGWGSQKITVGASQRDFESRRSVNALLARARASTRAWLGTDRDATDLWADLVEKSPDKMYLHIGQQGRFQTLDGRSVFIGGDDVFITTDDSKELGCHWESKTRHVIPLVLSEGPISDVGELFEAVEETNEPQVVYPLLGWVAATPFKPLFDKLGARFPVLLVYGQRGSGKTSMLQSVVLPLVGVRGGAVGSDVTPFALTAALSSTNAIPVWISEFRATTSRADEIQHQLRMCYDGQIVSRGREDLTVDGYELQAPVVMDSETIPPDSALRERLFPVRMYQKELNEETHRVAYERVLRMEDVQRRFAYNFIRWSLGLDEHDILPILDPYLKTFTERVSFGRLVRSASIVMTGLTLLRQFLKEHGVVMRVSDGECVDLVQRCIEVTYTRGLGTRTFAETLTELILHQYVEGQPWAQSCTLWDPIEGILWFSLTSVRYHLRRGDHTVPDYDMLRAQIEERVGLYIVGPRRVRGAIMFGIDIAKAQQLGLDAPDIKSSMLELSDE